MGVLPIRCRCYLVDRSIEFQEIQEGGQKGVVLHRVSLPAGRFDASSADILILLPAGYPDQPPDMFYAKPWLKLASSSGYPKAADQAFSFGGQSWQRWSRHNNSWRPGVDGIWTMLKRVELALAEAA